MSRETGAHISTDTKIPVIVSYSPYRTWCPVQVLPPLPGDWRTVVLAPVAPAKIVQSKWHCKKDEEVTHCLRGQDGLLALFVLLNKVVTGSIRNSPYARGKRSTHLFQLLHPPFENAHRAGRSAFSWRFIIVRGYFNDLRGWREWCSGLLLGTLSSGLSFDCSLLSEWRAVIGREDDNI